VMNSSRAEEGRRRPWRPKKRVQATTEVLNHVAHVREALKGFSGRDVRVLGPIVEVGAGRIAESSRDH
jgi:hypothetical protein